MMRKRLVALMVMLAVGSLLSGCGSSKASESGTNAAERSGTSSSYAAEYPQQYKEDFFNERKCGEEHGYTTAHCECEYRYIEAHVPYRSLEQGSPDHSKAEEAQNEASTQCLSPTQEHTPAEEEAHDRSLENHRKVEEEYARQEKEDQPAEEKLQKIREKLEYEHGE